MSAKVMVVDDSMMVRSQVGKALEPAGFSVVQATDGVDALEKLTEADDTSLVVLDFNMPRMNGLDLLRKLKEEGILARLQVVMLTTEGDPRLMRQAKELGARGWIIKPFKPTQLVAVVEKLTKVA